jgi:hypothetical protein
MEIEDKDFKLLINLLQKLVENQSVNASDSKKNNDTQPSSSDDNDESPRTKESVMVTKSRSYRPPFHNRFEDMPEKTMHKDDTLIDKKLNKLPPSQRNRKYDPVPVTCRVCGRKENVNPMFVESIERYKCNKCSTSAG